jgi:ceramide glucosyltransferase
MRREVFEQLDLPGAWQGSLNDDLLVTSLIRRAKLKVVYEPHCLVTSAAQFSFPGLLEFIRRQYFQVRIFTPRWWWLGLLVTGLTNSLYLGSALLTVAWAITGGPYGLPLAVVAGYYLISALRIRIRHQAIKPFLSIDEAAWRETSRFEILASPVTGLFSLIGILSAGIGRRITWRGIRYHVGGQNRTVIESRPPAAPRTDHSHAA